MVRGVVVIRLTPHFATRTIQIQTRFIDHRNTDIHRFSSEICGTIIVQCIPILRPFLKEVTTTFPSASKRSRQSSLIKSSKERASYGSSVPLKNIGETDRSPNEHDPEPDSETFIFGVERPRPGNSQPHSDKAGDNARQIVAPQPSPRQTSSHEPIVRPWSSGC